jgi:hypothetical protein
MIRLHHILWRLKQLLVNPKRAITPPRKARNVAPFKNEYA